MSYEDHREVPSDTLYLSHLIVFHPQVLLRIPVEGVNLPPFRIQVQELVRLHVELVRAVEVWLTLQLWVVIGYDDPHSLRILQRAHPQVRFVAPVCLLFVLVPHLHSLEFLPRYCLLLLRPVGEADPSMRHQDDPIALRLEDPYLPEGLGELDCVLAEEPGVSNDVEEWHALRMSLLDELPRDLVLVLEFILLLLIVVFELLLL